jgi:DNA-binding NtrC family response regulator
VNKKVLIVEDQFVEANDLQLMLWKAGYEVCGIARSVPIAQEMIKKENPGLVLLDIFLKGKLTGIDLAKQLQEENIAFIYLSANSNEEILSLAKTTEPDGFIVKPFREKDLLVTLEIAQYRHIHSREARYRREAELVQQLGKTAAVDISWTERLLRIGKMLQQVIPFDYLAIGFDDLNKNAGSATSFLRVGFDEYQTIGINELSTITATTADQLIKNDSPVHNESSPVYFNKEEFEKMIQRSPLKKLLAKSFHLKSGLSFPLLLQNGEKFSLQFYSRRPDTYNTEYINQLHHLHQTMKKNIERKPDVENTPINPKYQSRNDKTLDGDKTEASASSFEGIVGKSHLLLKVFDLITQVAPTDTTVLILGESGTGKERVADCIHQLSPRKNKPFVKINCTTLPSTLIESELFGHEKGSFTGALDKRIGKFEKADKGTVFLDEIGEISPDLQVKLLRVLQEKYIERIGATDITNVDVRIIAATNRNLEKEVAEGRFRLDLYYRLNVFPIELPPLRERTEDIPVLARHFIDYYNRKVGKKVTGLSDKVLKNLAAYHWPGNIRELENYIERSILLTKGNVIEESILLTKQSKDDSGIIQNTRAKTIFENERDYIIHVLKKCNGRIWGAGGAAEILNIPPTTLRSKMKKLGIEREKE